MHPPPQNLKASFHSGSLSSDTTKKQQDPRALALLHAIDLETLIPVKVVTPP
jgi:hypothetical protein